MTQVPLRNGGGSLEGIAVQGGFQIRRAIEISLHDLLEAAVEPLQRAIRWGPTSETRRRPMTYPAQMRATSRSPAEGLTQVRKPSPNTDSA